MAERARFLKRRGLWLLLLVLAGLAAYAYGRTRLPARFVLVAHLPPELDEKPARWPGEERMGVHRLARRLEDAARDARVAAVVLDLDRLEHVAPALVEELAPVLRRLRARKPVIAHAGRYAQSAYALALDAGEIWLHPMGAVDLPGVALVRPFLARALHRLGLRAIELRGGRYKAAAEPLVRTEMSPAAREEAERLARDLGDWLEARIRRRAPGFSISRYHEALAREGDWARVALRLHLVDRLGTRDELVRRLARRFSVDAREGFVDLERYPGLARPHEGAAIALVQAEGTLVAHGNAPGMLDARALAKALARAARDADVRAIVLRLTTPGGDALAAETVRAAIARIERRGKPVVVSMGAVCASGGYWIAAAARRIVAEPHTLTGSIGVIGVLWDASDALRRLGVRMDGYATSPWARPADRPVPPSLLRAWRTRLAALYDRFVALVAASRHMDEARVRALAEGHVWTGAEAKERGLVDRLGGLDAALEEAARLARLRAWHIEPFPVSPPWWMQLRAWLGGAWSAAVPALRAPQPWAWDGARWRW